jgi:hypothetical protein
MARINDSGIMFRFLSSSRAVDGDERPFAARAGVVDALREKLFSRPRLADDQDVGVRRGVAPRFRGDDIINDAGDTVAGAVCEWMLVNGCGPPGTLGISFM